MTSRESPKMPDRHLPHWTWIAPLIGMVLLAASPLVDHPLLAAAQAAGLIGCVLAAVHPALSRRASPINGQEEVLAERSFTFGPDPHIALGRRARSSPGRAGSPAVRPVPRHRRSTLRSAQAMQEAPRQADQTARLPLADVLAAACRPPS
ncbi:MAG: hypothetical protein ACREFU_14240 [Acetobacteraceae bacterium]